MLRQIQIFHVLAHENNSPQEDMQFYPENDSIYSLCEENCECTDNENQNSSNMTLLFKILEWLKC